MKATFLKNWKIYLIEAWGLAIFMISAAGFTILIEHPDFHFSEIIASAFVRRMLIGLAMGITAILLIYSKWGKQSGNHINPAVTLAQLHLDRIHWHDALFYIFAQFIGGMVGMGLMNLVLPSYLSDISVNYVVTTPQNENLLMPFLGEFLLSFLMLTMVLKVSNSTWANKTGYFVGLLITLFITFEAPVSGMSMNPARTFASAIWANNWTALWLYFIAPMSAMQLAALQYRWQYRQKHGECKTMKMHLSGDKNGCKTYEVLWHSNITKEELSVNP